MGICSITFAQKTINTNQDANQMILDAFSITFEPGSQIVANNSSIFLATIDHNLNGFPDIEESDLPTSNNLLAFNFDEAGNQILKYLIFSKNRSFSNENTISSKTVNNVEINHSISNLENKVQFYPNPTTGPIKISSLIRVDKIDIYSLSALSVKEKIKINFDKKGAQLNLESLPNGIYIISITLENNEIITKKIIKK